MKLFAFEKRKKDSIIITTAGTILALIITFGVIYQVWPGFRDSSKPDIRVEGISEGGRYTGQLSVTFDVSDDETGIAGVRMEIDSSVRYEKIIGHHHYFDGTVIDTAGLAEGEHRFFISVTDGSLWKQTETRSFPFYVDRTPPHLSIIPIKDTVLQGDTDGFLIKTDEELRSLSIETLGKKWLCYAVPWKSDTLRGLVGVNIFTPPADYEAKFFAEDLAGNKTSVSGRISVKYRRFLEETVEIPKEKAGILTSYKKINEDYEKIKAALAAGGKYQYWNGTFIRPVKGFDSSPFGIRRVYTNGSIVSCHAAIDIANKEGTPIAAANNGVVLLAEELFVYGNMVILDHGQGVVTFYCHMSKLNAGKGDLVAKGATLGLMGTTGLSTGSHLHWEMQVQGTPVNPDDWLKTGFETAGE